MTVDAAQLDALSAITPGARPLEEAGIDYVFIPNLTVIVGATEYVMDALLCPMQHGGYSTRLFLAEMVPASVAKNWTSHLIYGRTWHTWSWQGIPAGMALAQILAAHLRALR